MAEFLDTPLGKSYQALERGDHVFLFNWDVERREGFTAVGGKVMSTRSDGGDLNEFLNGVCKMGWELLNGSYVFVPEKEHERERFLGKGGNTAISGPRWATSCSVDARPTATCPGSRRPASAGSGWAIGRTRRLVRRRPSNAA